jgi:hypothetical protein
MPVREADPAQTRQTRPAQLTRTPRFSQLDVARRDLAFYQERSSGPTTSGFFTGDSSYSIAWLAVGNRTQADAQFAQGFAHLDLVGFGVWMEVCLSLQELLGPPKLLVGFGVWIGLAA